MQLKHLPLLLAGPSAVMAFAPKGPVPMPDGVEPSTSTDVAYTFRCGGATTRLSYRQELRDPDRFASLADALVVTLSSLRISDRTIRAPGMQDARNLFRSFASVDRVTARCFEGAVYVEVFGLPLRPWVDYLEKDLPDRPAQVTETLRVSNEGDVQIIPYSHDSGVGQRQGGPAGKGA